MNYTFSIDKDIDNDLLEIVKSYWEYKEDGFLHSPKELANDNNITTADLNKIIKKYSKCNLVLGYCKDCSVEIVKEVYSQSSFKENKRNKKNRCQDCETEYWKNIEIQRIQTIEQARLSKIEKFKNAVRNQEWTNLSLGELETLKDLLRNKTKKLIYQNVFNNNPFDKSVWKVVNKLERLGLLEVMRSDYNGSVNGFDFPENLFEQLELKRANEKRSYFSFSLDQNQFKSKPKHPEYSGTFTLTEEVVLQAGVKYIYGGWTNTDGSIHFKFQPESEISNRIEQTKIESEPQHIKEIVNNMSDELDVEPF